MRRIFGMTMFLLGLATVSAAETVHCTTREAPAFTRWVTTCRDGARSITRWDEALKRWQTDIITPPKGDKPPPGWPLPAKPHR